MSSADPIADAIAERMEAPMVTHYVVVAALIDENGTETTACIPSPGLPLWMQHGLLAYEAAASVPQPIYQLAEDEDDDE